MAALKFWKRPFHSGFIHCFHFMRFLLFYLFIFIFCWTDWTSGEALNDDEVKTFFTFTLFYLLFSFPSAIRFASTSLTHCFSLSLSLFPSGSCEELISLVWCFSSRQLDGLPIKSRTNAVSVGRAIQYSSAMFQTTAVLSLFLSVSLAYEKLFHFWQR